MVNQEHDTCKIPPWKDSGRDKKEKVNKNNKTTLPDSWELLQRSERKVQPLILYTLGRIPRIIE